MYSNNFFKTRSFFLKKNHVFSLERANKRKKNLILPLNFNKVEEHYPQNETRLQFIMQINPVYRLFVFLTALSFMACTSDEMVLTVGEDVMSDDHKAYYTENFTINSKTKLAEYETTNNTGVALCGSYIDDYIGEITTNTVFKISPNVYTSNIENNGFLRTAIFDSMVFIMRPNGYVYGDTSSNVNLAIYKLTEDYDLDSIRNIVDGITYYNTLMKNNSTTSYDPVPVVNFSFVPEDADDSIEVVLPQDLGQEWFDNIITQNDNFVINTGETSDKNFIENVLPGLTVRSVGNNSTIVGFDMPTSDNSDATPGMTIRMYYHTLGPHTEWAYDFTIYQPSYQYNQITADFSQGVLSGIEAGGEGISSTKTNNLTFIQSGLGLMTEIEIPTLNEMYVFGTNPTIIDLNLDFIAEPRSFTNNINLPTAMSIDLLKNNGLINSSGLTGFDGTSAAISTKTLTDYEAEYSIPISYYGWQEQQLFNSLDIDHQTLLLTARQNGSFISNVNRMVIGDANNNDCQMKVKMYYTTFE